MYNNSASKVSAFGGPSSYQAKRPLSVEVAGSNLAAVSSVLAFCLCKQEPWAVSTATECGVPLHLARRRPGAASRHRRDRAQRCGAGTSAARRRCRSRARAQREGKDGRRGRGEEKERRGKGSCCCRRRVALRLPDRPSGTSGDHQHTRDGPTAASPAPAPAPAFAGPDTEAEACVPAATRAQARVSPRRLGCWASR